MKQTKKPTRQCQYSKDRKYGIKCLSVLVTAPLNRLDGFMGITLVGWEGVGGEPLSSLCQDSVSLICFNYTAFVLHQLFVIIGGSGTNIILSRQNFCHDKLTLCLSLQNFCRFVAASIFSSRQKTCFVATKMILVEAPVNDSSQADRRIKDCLTDESAQTLIHC